MAHQHDSPFIGGPSIPSNNIILTLESPNLETNTIDCLTLEYYQEFCSTFLARHDELSPPRQTTVTLGEILVSSSKPQKWVAIATLLHPNSIIEVGAHFWMGSAKRGSRVGHGMSCSYFHVTLCLLGWISKVQPPRHSKNLRIWWDKNACQRLLARSGEPHVHPSRNHVELRGLWYAPTLYVQACFDRSP
jgi:hypothetical protein